MRAFAGRRFPSPRRQGQVVPVVAKVLEETVTKAPPSETGKKMGLNWCRRLCERLGRMGASRHLAPERWALPM
jgi:hypothetical protein